MANVTDPKVVLMEARLKAAELRTRATHQHANAAAHTRQAAKPIYDGQTEVCMGKAATIESLAAKTRAEADLIDAEAEAAYKAATGEESPSTSAE